MDKKSENIIKELKILEDQKKWDDCINFFKKNLKTLKNKKYLYVSINYFFMNLLLEEGLMIDNKIIRHYHDLSINYFNQSYKLFKNDAEYLYLSGKIIFPSPWYFGNYDRDFPEKMIDKAIKLKPYSYISKIEFFHLFRSIQLIKENKNLKRIINDSDRRFNFLKNYFSKNIKFKIINKLKKFGSFGEYFIEINFQYYL